MMIKNKTYKQNRSANNWPGTRLVRLMKPFAAVHTLYTDLDVAVQIKEDSP
jgi:hypothetical protein